MAEAWQTVAAAGGGEALGYIENFLGTPRNTWDREAGGGWEVGTIKSTEFGYVTSFAFALLEVHCKCVSLIKFRTAGAIISSNIFSALFILSPPSETLIDCMLDLSIALCVPEALFLFSAHFFSLCSSD